MLGAGPVVTPGDQFRIDLANIAVKQVNPFLTVLLVFAVVACVVAAFVIYNTFTILVAQRIRELALLRLVGAGRGQVFRSVLLESAIVGLLGAVVGVGLGLAVAYGLFSGADALGVPLPAHLLVLTPTPVLVALGLGLVVTVCSAVLPAVRATRVSPLAALRADPLGRVSGVRRRVVRVIFAVLAGGLGTYLTMAGSSAKDPKNATLLVVTGGIVNFLAVLVLSPLFVGPLTAALGWLPGKVFGTPAKLASANARRNPGRAAATTSALMIGVGLMSAASVALATVQVTATRQIGGHYPVDSRTTVESVTNDFPLVSVGSLASWRSRITSAVNQMIGIMNTLSLSVFERTRESAVLRAVGLTRSQLRATLLVDALLMAVVGALVGVGFGVLYGWATTRVMFAGIQPIITIPVGQLLGYLALAALAGVVAAVLPARRAARASTEAAMAET